MKNPNDYCEFQTITTVKYFVAYLGGNPEDKKDQQVVVKYMQAQEEAKKGVFLCGRHGAPSRFVPNGMNKKFDKQERFDYLMPLSKEEEQEQEKAANLAILDAEHCCGSCLGACKEPSGDHLDQLALTVALEEAPEPLIEAQGTREAKTWAILDKDAM